ncbi:MAG: sulfatase-like hydrolase/transferase [Kiritimatiellaeota bacterium]|nr:sulfatase-like hydrolase/transferase [Kiritimatiellota bacterium]
MSKPNVIVFFTDQQRWDTCGFHGNPLGLTPNLDRAAANGTDFHNCFTCQPVCGPARAVLQSGVYPTTNGAFTNDKPLPRDSVTLARLFNQAGYRTGYIGKWHLAPGNGAVPEDQRGGYTDWLASNTLEFTSDAYRTRMFDNDNKPVDLPGYRVDALTDAAIRYVDSHKAEPFFLFVSYIEPHFQNHLDSYPAPDGYAQRFTDRWTPPDLQQLGGTSARHLPGYYGMVKRLDEAYGRLRDALKSLALDDDTVVLFTTDHGLAFPWMKCNLHDDGTGVTLMLRYPGNPSRGRALDSLTSHLDVFPTLCDLLGLEKPDWLQGVSLLPVLNRERGEVRGELFSQVLYHAAYEPQLAVRTHRHKYIRRYTPDYPFTALPNIDHGATYDYLMAHGIAEKRLDEEQLYDLVLDPMERDNLAAKPGHAETLRDMRVLLDTWMRETDHPLLRGPVPLPKGAHCIRPACPSPSGLTSEDKIIGSGN